MTFDDVMASAAGHLEAMRETSDLLAGIRGHARSADGTVTAVVDACGMLVGLVVAESLRTHRARDVAALVVTVSAAAADSAATERERALASLRRSLAGG